MAGRREVQLLHLLPVGGTAGEQCCVIGPDLMEQTTLLPLSN